jgi:predicted DNA-binding antitoxin AbrB/MazE fold protein
MGQDISAIYENGHLRLLEPVDLAEGERVTVKILTANAEDEVLRKALGDSAIWPDPNDDRHAELEAIAQQLARELSADKLVSDYISEDREDR